MVAGTSSDSTGSDMAVARYHSNGTPDLTFDGDGIALVDLGMSRRQGGGAQPHRTASWCWQERLRTKTATSVAAPTLARAVRRPGAPGHLLWRRGRVFTDSPGPRHASGAASAVVVRPDGRTMAAGTSLTGGRVPTSPSPAAPPRRLIGSTFSRRRSDGDGLRRIPRRGPCASHRMPGDASSAAAWPVSRNSSLPTRCVTSAWFAARLAAFWIDVGRHSKVHTDLGGDVNGITEIVVQRDGRIVAAANHQEDVGLTRYSSSVALTTASGTVGSSSPRCSLDEVGGLDFDPGSKDWSWRATTVAPAAFVSRYLGE